MLIGYARVSTKDQKLQLQKDALYEIGCEKIFVDKISGNNSDRPGLIKTLEFIRKGDILVIWRLDRLSRSLKDLINLMNLLESKSIGLKSIKECIDTNSISGKLFFHIFSALAEFERNVISERTRAGLQAARDKGCIIGRPKSLNENKKNILLELYQDKKNSISSICKKMKISKTTLYKYIK